MAAFGGHGRGCVHCSEASEGLSLFSVIHTDGVVGLNEEVDGSAKGVFKPYEDRFDDPVLVSDADAQLIVHVPFTASVKLQSLVVAGDGPEDSFPSRVLLFANPKTTIDFSNAESLTPTQELELPPDFLGLVPVLVNPPLFSALSSLTLFFPANHSGDEDEQTRIRYIGLGGEHRPIVGSREVVITAYESAPQPGDHKVKDDPLAGGSAPLH